MTKTEKFVERKPVQDEPITVDRITRLDKRPVNNVRCVPLLAVFLLSL